MILPCEKVGCRRGFESSTRVPGTRVLCFVHATVPPDALSAVQEAGEYDVIVWRRGVDDPRIVPREDADTVGIQEAGWESRPRLRSGSPR